MLSVVALQFLVLNQGGTEQPSHLLIIRRSPVILSSASKEMKAVQAKPYVHYIDARNLTSFWAVMDNGADQSVSWSGACEYQAGSLPRRRSMRVNGESGILAFSSSSSSSAVGGNPSGTGNGRSFSLSAFTGTASSGCRSLCLFSTAVSP